MDSFPMGGMGQISICLMAIKKDTFCVAPWYSVFVASDGKIAPCCKFTKPSHSYKQIEEYFMSSDLDKVRQDLLNGVKNANCAKCWTDEDNSGDSLRLISNRTIAKEIKAPLSEQIKNPKLSNIKSFDLTLGNICNLKCVMCSPELSSQLLAEVNLNPELKPFYNKEYSQKEFDWPKSKDFVAWCDQYLPQAIHIKFTGGEPFIIPWIQDVIERIPDSQKKKCILHFTTNLTVLNHKLFNCFSKFKEVWISVSVEGSGKTHEYLRFGHSWDVLTDHIAQIKEMTLDNVMLKINHVVQSPSYQSIIEMTEFFDSKKLAIHPILLSGPKHFQLSSLSEMAKQNFLDLTAGYDGFNKQFIDFVRKVSREHLKQDRSLTEQCVKHLDSLDRVRKNSYKDIIPPENISV